MVLGGTKGCLEEVPVAGSVYSLLGPEVYDGPWIYRDLERILTYGGKQNERINKESVPSIIIKIEWILV